jgi:class 3 adenylate cyclase
LDLWYRDALRGEPRLALVTGDAGVGKSRLIDEWLRQSDDGVMRLLAGSAYEDVATPLLAIASALRDLPGMADVFTAARTAAEPDVGELQLYLSVPKAILDAASYRPTVLLLNDLHWADRATLDMLGHLVACAGRAPRRAAPRLLVIVTGRGHGIGEGWQRLLQRLPLEPMCRTLPLAGLDELGVNELLASFAGVPPAKQLVRSVLEATGGNPLLIDVLLSRLDANGLLEVRMGRLVATAPPERFVVAADLEEAWAIRLDKLGSAGRHAILLAALLGDGGSLADLRAVSGLDTDGLAEILELATTAGLLSGGGGTYQFHHPYVRRAMVAALPPGRREQLEALIATRLLEAHPDDDEYTLAIVQHLRRAGSTEAAHCLRKLAPVAAEQANALSAWGLAASCYEDALAAVDESTSPAELALLHLRAGQAHHRNHDFSAALPHHLDAVALARQEGDLALWGEALFWLGGVAALQRSDGGQFDEALVADFLEQAGDELPDERALVLAYVAQHHFGRLEPAAGIPAITTADALTQVGVRPSTRHFVAHIQGTISLGCLDLVKAHDGFAEALALNGQHHDRWQAVWVEVGAPLVGLVAGQLDEADAQAARAVVDSSECQQWDLHGLGMALRAAIAVAQGRTDDGQRYALQGVQSYHRSDFFYAGSLAFPHLAAARAYLGDGPGARGALKQWQECVGGFALGHALLVEAYAGDLTSLEEMARRFQPSNLASEPNLFSLHGALVAIEVGERLGRLDWVEAGFTHLHRAMELGVHYTLEWARGVVPTLARAAITLDRLDDAARLLDLAASDTASPFDFGCAEISRARLSLAAGIASDAVGHLRAALDYFEPANLLPFCREVHQLAPDGSLALRRDLVVLYTDIVGSTQLNVSMGDQLFVEMLRRHNEIVRSRLSRFGGLQFTHTGDGVGARFGSVDAALGFALGLQREFDEGNRTRDGLPLEVRIGLARGDALEEEGNLFGQTVVRAVRICASAGAGQVCVGAEVAMLADPVTFRFNPLGHVPLKGFDGSHELFEVRATTPSVPSLSVTH